MSPKVIRCQDETHVRQELLRALQTAVDAARDRPLFSLAVSGGSLVSLLSHVVGSVRGDLSTWRVFLCDERLVPEDHAESTFGAYRKQMLANTDRLRADQFLRVDQSLEGARAAQDYEARMRLVFGACEWPQMDLVLLGMGPDGHTASLFPGHAALRETRAWVVFVADSPKVSGFRSVLPATCSPHVLFQPPPQRVTLTLPVLNHARHALFVATGAQKAHALKTALEGLEELPCAQVRPSGGVTWLVDAESARLLSSVE